MWWLLACGSPTEAPPEPTDAATTGEASSPPTSPTGETAAPPHSAALDPATLPGNLLVLLADDYGVDKVGAYHATDADVRTPVIDSLAASGTLFRNAWGYTACSPARAALQTGRHARRTGYGVNWEIGMFPWGLPEPEVTVAEMLASSAWWWSTSYVGKWHLASDNLPNLTGAPHRQGWRYYAGSMPSTLRLPPEPKGPDGHYSWWKKTLDDESQIITETYATTDTANDAVARLEVMREPWVMVVAFNAIHEPHHLPPDALHTYDGLTEKSDPRDLARAMNEAMDTEIGRILAAIEPEVRARTTIVFLGDNGDSEDTLEAQTPNAKTSGTGTGTEDPLNIAKGSMRDFGIRVPLIVSGPHVAQPGVATDALASVVDVFATAADLAFVDPSELPAPIDGVSLLPVLADPAARVREYLYTERVGPLGLLPSLWADERVIRDDRYKLRQDVTRGTESFHEYVSGQIAEGPNLLRTTMTAEQQAAYDRLSAAIDAQVALMTAGG